MTRRCAAHVVCTLLVMLLTSLLVDAARAGALEEVERAVEVTLDQLTLPAANGDAIRFRECPTCESRTHRFSASTVFQVAGQTLPVPDFVRFAHRVADRPKGAARAIVVVFLDVTTGGVTRVELRE